MEFSKYQIAGILQEGDLSLLGRNMLGMNELGTVPWKMEGLVFKNKQTNKTLNIYFIWKAE